MLITAVEPRRKAMCALYIDGEYVMNLDARTVIENRFDVGSEWVCASGSDLVSCYAKSETERQSM